MTVTALLVSHDGARWLPAVLDGLEAQTRPPDHLVAVDTGSSDATLALLTGRIGAEAVVPAGPELSYCAAVRVGLDHLEGTGDEWLWLLHDDSRPAPDALEVLLTTARENPAVSILGPKLRAWPSLRRLLEMGVTIGGTGRRETGLERGEYDQGQHDRTHDALAVNTAGMLVRRDVFDQLGGFDPRLPLFGNDIDFGWRAARAGHRTLVVPDAVVFHVEAAHRGVRRTRVTGSFRREERRAALYTLLVNCSLVAPALPRRAPSTREPRPRDRSAPGACSKGGVRRAVGRPADLPATRLDHRRTGEETSDRDRPAPAGPPPSRATVAALPPRPRRRHRRCRRCGAPGR